MPTVARIGPYRFFFFGNEGNEPPHIHVQRERLLAKYWLNEVALAKSRGFAAHELRQIEKLVLENKGRFLEAWNEFFGG
ncbi:MAG: DUF4160 domain-containing protein [Planctomycetia bacterium]|jgi:hypothetical protein|nr:DUF4160 domain-containing protein [Planctomycetia bacterium]MCC7314816.1 DUF4160 domain-containing protein [Planctomycetota bacterium]OQY98394.1 MAG: hypothetical protein B6D36_17610 [Planctomycetes bacterium UTPLA1]